MRTLSTIGLTLFFAASIAAQGIQEWKTPDGKAYFGDHPPAGSVAAKKIDKPIGRVKAAPLPARASRAMPKRPYVWRDGVECQDLTFLGVKEEKFDGISRRIVRGTLKHDGRHLVRNVQVCSGKICQSLRAGRSMNNGDSEDFSLDVPSADPVPVRVECSIREPRG